MPPSTPAQLVRVARTPLGLLLLAGIGVGFLLVKLWELLNQKAKEEQGVYEGEILNKPSNGSVRIVGTLTTPAIYATRCPPLDPGIPFLFQDVYSEGFDWQGSGVSRLDLVRSQVSTRAVCGDGPPTYDDPVGTLLKGYNASGEDVANWGNLRGGTRPGTTEWVDVTSVNIASVSFNGVVQPPPASGRPLLPEGVRFAPPLPSPVTRPATDPLPGAVPLPTPAPALVPGAVPLPNPAPAPGGLPSTAPRPAPLPRPVTRPAPGGQPAPVGTAPQTLTAGGVRPQLPPAPTTTATGTTIMPGGQPLAPNGPRPTPQAMATEMGKLERKLELALAPEGPLSLLQQLNRAIDQIENIKFLLDALFPPEPYTFGAGEYGLQPVCDRNSEGQLLPPMLAQWTGGEGEVVEVNRKLDAIATLIQFHKELKQPGCGGPGTGPHGNVTVHFESD